MNRDTENWALIKIITEDKINTDNMDIEKSDTEVELFHKQQTWTKLWIICTLAAYIIDFGL